MEAAILQFVNGDILSGTGAVDADAEIVLDGTLDSLAIARLIGFIEAESGIAVPAEDVTIENFRTIKTMVDYVSRRIEQEPST